MNFDGQAVNYHDNITVVDLPFFVLQKPRCHVRESVGLFLRGVAVDGAAETNPQNLVEIGA